jgi:hypothetical protein
MPVFPDAAISWSLLIIRPMYLVTKVHHDRIAALA